MECAIVDVFAEAPLSGNQLAVVRGAGALDTVRMQAIAREMNFSETTFVTAEDAAGARVRIFTPERELPFAGHPTLGTAWVLAAAASAPPAVYTLELAAGRVPVTFGSDGLVWMTPPPVSLAGTLPAATAAALLGLDESALAPGHACRLATVGPSFVLAGVRDLAALGRIAVDAAVHADLKPLAGDDALLGVFAFCDQTRAPDADFAARMLLPGSVPAEDPATGSANTAFAAYLRERGVRGRLAVEQGVEMGRPSRLELDIGDPIRVGGRVFPVLTGVLHA